MLEVLDTRPRSRRQRHRAAAPPVRAIEIPHLTFSYRHDRPVLKDVTSRRAGADRRVRRRHRREVDAHQPAAGLHEPARHRFDGVDIREIPLERLRGAIGFVRRSRSCSRHDRGNVAFGGAKDRISGPDRARRRPSRGWTRTSPTFPRGFETTVGERGHHAVGRAEAAHGAGAGVMIDPAILILDDALSAVDTYTEEEILSRLRGVMRQRTSILVSHRISTVREADRSSSSTTAGSPSAARTTSSSRRTASTRDVSEAAAGRGAAAS
jgi:ATP-binding cassette subfamily B protein